MKSIQELRDGANRRRRFEKYVLGSKDLKLSAKALKRDAVSGKYLNGTAHFAWTVWQAALLINS